MRRLFKYVLPFVLVLVPLSCSDKGKIIKQDRMKAIYADMLLADQWLSEYPEFRVVADTTLFYEPVFKAHGVSLADFNASVDYYIDHPDKYMDLMRKVSDELKDKAKKYDKLAAHEREIRMIIFRTGYKQNDFSSDSVIWHSAKVMWPSKPEKIDTTSTYVERKDSIRTDQEQEIREFPGDKSLATRREAL